MARSLHPNPPSSICPSRAGLLRLSFSMLLLASSLFGAPPSNAAPWTCPGLSTYVPQADDPAATTERWLCPHCLKEVIDRPIGADSLRCPACGAAFGQIDLAPPVAYINSRTRDAEVAWSLETSAEKCGIFRFDGLKAQDGDGKIWIPWTAVEWFIPRQRIVHLVNGCELGTDYAMTPERCPSPTKFTFDVSDSLTIPGQPPTSFKQTQNESLAELFIVAMSPEALDSARVRFVAEVEGGKHPRLPRTQPRLYRTTPTTLPPDLATLDFKGEADYDVRVHENRGVIGIRMIQGTGNAELDALALRAVRSAGYTPGGEMGVGVPAWTRARVIFDGKTATVQTEAAPRGFWRR